MPKNQKNRKQYEPLYEGTKACVQCRYVKSVTDFVVDRYLSDGRTRDCKLCRAKTMKPINEKFHLNNPDAKRRYADSKRQRGYALKYKFKITEAEYNKQVLYQSGLCAICREVEPEVVDHDHGCCDGQRSCGDCLRGILCHRCNRGIGHFNDNIDRLKRAIHYLSLGGVWQDAW